MPYALAVDIGGSGLRAARIGQRGIDGRAERRSLDASVAREQLEATLRDAVDALGEGAGDLAAGVSFPGFLDREGLPAWCVNLPGLDGVDLRAVLGTAPSRPVVPVPDLLAAAIAEARLGTGAGVERFLCVGLGTGVNAAMVAGGQPLVTAVGCLGDAGHVCVEPDGPVCACGGRGCLEAIASGPAISRSAAALGLAGAAAAVEAARAGHGGALAVLERAGRALGRAIAIWSALLWPDRVAVAGGVARGGDLLLDPAREELRRVGASYIVDGIDLVEASLGADASLIGAGLAALDASGARG